MNSSFLQVLRGVFALLVFVTNVAVATGSLAVEQAWIRAAPPGASMLAGYAILKNVGELPLTIVGARSAAFRSVGIHETVEVGGVSKMRPLKRIEITPGASVTLSPGGKHLMLMSAASLAVGGTVTIAFEFDDGSSMDAEFSVREDVSH